MAFFHMKEPNKYCIIYIIQRIHMYCTVYPYKVELIILQEIFYIIKISFNPQIAGIEYIETTFPYFYLYPALFYSL